MPTGFARRLLKVAVGFLPKTAQNSQQLTLLCP